MEVGLDCFSFAAIVRDVSSLEWWIFSYDCVEACVRLCACMDLANQRLTTPFLQDEIKARVKQRGPKKKSEFIKEEELVCYVMPMPFSVLVQQCWQECALSSMV